MNQLPPGPPAKPHPIDVALAALSEHAAELLASDRPSRFAEIGTVSLVAQQIQRLKPAASVDEIGEYDQNAQFAVGGAVGQFPNPFPMRGLPQRFNDGADLNRELLMLVQGFMTQYLDVEKTKAKGKSLDSRLNEVSELAELMELRLKLSLEDQPVPDQLNYRVDCLLKRIGEPPHEPEPEPPAPGPLVPADPLRGYSADGPGEPDRDRVGEPLAE